MKYIYDVLLNFNDIVYDVFEWNTADYITHIRKIPFFKVKEEDFYKIMHNNVKFGKEFLSSIYKKTEYFSKNKVNNIDYAFLITSGHETLAIKLEENVLYSKLLYEEELETLEYSMNMKVSNIDYEIGSPKQKNNFETRNELYMKSYISKELNTMLYCGDNDKVKYIYLEIFDKPLNGEAKDIFKELENNWDTIYLKLYELLKTISLR